MANMPQFNCKALDRGVSSSFEELAATIEFPIFDGVLVNPLIGTKELVGLQADVDVRGQFAKFRIGRKVFRVEPKTETDALPSAVENSED